MNIKTIWYSILGGLAAVGGFLGQLFGGWDIALQALCFMMAADYITGIVCALVWKKSPKSSDGAYDSKVSIKGLLRKGGMLLIVLVGCRLDSFIGTEFIRTAVITFFIANEGFSLIENLGVMGVPMPKVIKNAFEALKEKVDNALPDLPTDDIDKIE